MLAQQQQQDLKRYASLLYFQFLRINYEKPIRLRSTHVARSHPMFASGLEALSNKRMKIFILDSDV